MRVTDEMVEAARDAARRVAGVAFTPSGLLLREAIEAALAAAPQAEQEPVAWRWKAVIDGDQISNWVLTHSDPPPYAVARQPLYTAPQPAPDDKLREAARLYIDGEWNSYSGDLLSMALVSAAGDVWYEVLEFSGVPDPWVAENVLPKLRRPAVSLAKMQASLQTFLSQFPAVHIVADWPEDIERFCRLLVTGPGTRIETPSLTMEIVRIDTVSADPHNALADAMALRKALEGKE